MGVLNKALTYSIIWFIERIDTWKDLNDAKNKFRERLGNMSITKVIFYSKQMALYVKQQETRLI